jgi:integrase
VTGRGRAQPDPPAPPGAPADAAARLDRYLEAAARPNTQRSYDQAVRHFEVEAGRPLPATPDQVAQYLADFAGQLAVATLRQRLAALGRWHRDHGFPDPTRAARVRQTLKGIQAVHGQQARQATPLQLVQLGRVADWLESAVQAALTRNDPGAALRHRRDRALVLLGFWRGFRGDELLRLRVEHLTLVRGEGLSCYLPVSKTDIEGAGRTFQVPALARWCPVEATADWLAAADLVEGPLLRAVDRWGRVSARGLHPNSFIAVLRRLFAQAGLPEPTGYSGHSLRRGFAAWANAQGWDIKTLMEYVGWRDVASAMRYLQADPFARYRAEAARLAEPSQPSALPPPTAPVAPHTVTLELTLGLIPFTARGRGHVAAQRLFEVQHLAPFAAVRLDAEGRTYRLTVPAPDATSLDEVVASLLDDLYRTAEAQRCFLEATVREVDGPRRWH